ncbi:hypothetical protein F5Y05DRAFT_417840 [Hypoxylon sp. FL0543]|nr:hypothetical protein F5Y05DRAFT_417840 [Hypoxylon sp. FL0543]
MASTNARPVWPAQKLPLELFVMIGRHLPNRNDIKSMRLVNREFNTKLVRLFVERIVIRMSQELSFQKDSTLAPQDGLPFIDVVMDVLGSDLFRSFGGDIRRLGLALELEEYELATPITGDLEDIRFAAFGIYRWARPVDGPDSVLGRLTASLESQGIFRLLTGANQVRELALSCDACLGYLQGPDVNPLQPPGRAAVFGDSYQARTANPKSLVVEFDKPYKLELLEQKLAAAGVSSPDMPRMIAQLCDNENVSLSQLTHEERRASCPQGSRQDADLGEESKESSKIRLQPRCLTDVQKRFLFQYLSAQQALTQSFLIAVMDNGSIFTRLTKLNIARFPSLYLDFLCVHGFWTALPGLKEVALGVIPDWRELFQLDGSTVGDALVYPTDALYKVFHLLKNYVGQQSRIKRLHFEWHCGGELAAGCVQRGKYVLPAPFLKYHRKVVDSRVEKLLILPFITHLSLKNCWFAPNVFYRIMYVMAKEHSLESLELETVSLSGPPVHRLDMQDAEHYPPRRPTAAQLYHGLIPHIPPQHGLPQPANPPNTPNQAIQHNGNIHPLSWQNQGRGQSAQQDQPQQNENEDLDNESKYPLREPLWLSWPHIIDLLTPGGTIHEFVSGRPVAKNLKLSKLSFKSCGYVQVTDYRFISDRRFRSLQVPADIVDEADAAAARFKSIRAAVQPFLQECNDRHAGKIVNIMDPWEKSIMRRVWGFRFGWVGVYPQHAIDAALHDGSYAPGFGRFSGTIEHDPNTEQEDAQPYVFDTGPFDREYDDTLGLGLLLNQIRRANGYN